MESPASGSRERLGVSAVVAVLLLIGLAAGSATACQRSRSDATTAGDTATTLGETSTTETTQPEVEAGLEGVWQAERLPSPEMASIFGVSFEFRGTLVSGGSLKRVVKTTNPEGRTIWVPSSAECNVQADAMQFRADMGWQEGGEFKFLYGATYTIEQDRLTITVVEAPPDIGHPTGTYRRQQLPETLPKPGLNQPFVWEDKRSMVGDIDSVLVGVWIADWLPTSEYPGFNKIFGFTIEFTDDGRLVNHDPNSGGDMEYSVAWGGGANFYPIYLGEGTGNCIAGYWIEGDVLTIWPNSTEGSPGVYRRLL
jgi:hypothetical protein